MNEKQLPLVSIVITSYNRGKWIGRAIETALMQDYPNFEVVISDNCSTDNTHEVVQSFSNDPRVRYSKNETNIGMIPNFNKAFFELAKGEYVTSISSDDYLTNPKFISTAISIINKYEDISVVFGIHNQINDQSGIVSPNPLPGKHEIECRRGVDIFFDFAENPYYSSAGAVYSMSHLRKIQFRFSGRATGDIEINVLLMLCGNVGFINESVYMIRVHGNNASGSFKNVGELEDMYMDVYNYLYPKAATVIQDKSLMAKWYRKLIVRGIIPSLHMIIDKKSRRQLLSFNGLMLKKYRSEYLRFLATHPKYIAKIILNR